MQLEASYFTRYDALHRDLASLTTADFDLARAKQLLQSATWTEASTRKGLADNHHELARHQKKVDGHYSNPSPNPETPAPASVPRARRPYWSQPSLRPGPNQACALTPELIQSSPEF